jgi:hypothetical protein
MQPSVAINYGNPNDNSDAQNIPMIGIRDVGAAEACLSHDTIIQTTCDSIIFNGISYTTDTTIIHDTLLNVMGCDSVIFLNVVIVNVDTAVNVQGLTLQSEAVSATYQWVDCVINTPIINEVDSVFNVTQSGSYSVEITQNGCVDSSACFTFVNVGITKVETVGKIEIYPNPTSHQLNIETQNFKIIKLQIRDNTGKLVRTITSNFKLVNVESLATGVYHLEIIGEEESVRKKFIKQ